MNTVFRPLGAGDIFGAAVGVYGRAFGTFAKIVLIVIVPVQLLSALLIVGASDGPLVTRRYEITNRGLVQVAHVSSRALVVLLLATLVTSVASQIAGAASFLAARDTYLGRARSSAESVRAAFSWIGSLLWVLILMFLTFFGLGIAVAVVVAVAAAGLGAGGFALAALFGFCATLFLLVSWSMAVPALLAEGFRGSGALRRSRELVRGSWWHVFWVFFVAGVLLLIVAVALALVVAASGVASRGSTAGRYVELLVFPAFAALIFTPLAASLQAILHLDLRVRREGPGPAQGAQSPGTPPPSGQPPSAAGWTGAGGVTWQPPPPAPPPPLQQELPPTTWEPGSGLPALRPPGVPPPA